MRLDRMVCGGGELPHWPAEITAGQGGKGGCSASVALLREMGAEGSSATRKNHSSARKAETASHISKEQVKVAATLCERE